MEVVEQHLHGYHSVEVKGQPVNLSARFKLKPSDDGGCDYSIDYQCKAAIPLAVEKSGRVHYFSQTAGGLEQE